MKTSVFRKLLSLGFFYFCCYVVLWLAGWSAPCSYPMSANRPALILFAWIVLSWFVDFDPYRWLDKLKPESAAPPETGEQDKAG